MLNIYEIGVIISIAAIILGSILLTVFLALWTYKDAKLRGLLAPLWTCLVIFIPNLLGFIVYLVVRFVSAKVACPNCKTFNDKNATYCSNCRETIDIKTIAPYSKKHHKLFIGAAISILLIFLGCVGFSVSTYASIPSTNPMNVSIGKVENTWKGVWSMKISSSTETIQKSFTHNPADPGVLRITSTCQSGTVTMHVISDEVANTYDITDTNGTLVIDLADYPGKKVNLMIVNDKVKDLDFEADWSNQ